MGFGERQEAVFNLAPKFYLKSTSSPKTEKGDLKNTPTTCIIVLSYSTKLLPGSWLTTDTVTHRQLGQQRANGRARLLTAADKQGRG